MTQDYAFPDLQVNKKKTLYLIDIASNFVFCGKSSIYLETQNDMNETWMIHPWQYLIQKNPLRILRNEPHLNAFNFRS
jgi:hypothetical protein